MYLPVLFLLLLLFPNKSFAEYFDTKNLKQNIVQVEIPFVIFICEYCQKQQEKISTNYNINIIKKIPVFKFIPSSAWANESQSLLKKQQATEYQIMGTKSWPPHIPFSISPLIEKKGLIVFINYLGEMNSHSTPVTLKYVLYYNNKVLITNSENEMAYSLNESLPKLSKRDGIRFFIDKEVSGEELPALENSIKSFTANKNSIIIPYEVTKDGVRYHSDIETTHIMRTIKQINQFVPNLSAKLANGTNDAIEISKSQ